MTDSNPGSGSDAMWRCLECGREFADTVAALDHRLRNTFASIWPVYGEGFDDA